MRTYTAIEAAERVGVAYSTMREHVRAGKVHAKRTGRSLSITEAELRRVYPDAFADESAADQADDEAADRADQAVDTADKAAEAAGLAIENAVLRAKLHVSERQAESLRTDLDRSQGQLDDALASVRSLTDEVKGLTAMVHAHRALPSPVGWLRSIVRQLVTLRV